MKGPEKLWVFFVLAFVTVSGKESESIPTECKELLNDLGAALSVFDQCALDNSRPFEVCRQCASIYETTHTLYSNVIHFRDDRSKKCRTLVEDGRISLVKINFEHMETIWNNDGVCGDCFESNSFNISKQVIEFFELRDQLQGCIDRTWDFNTTCENCDPEFRNLTSYFYHVLESENNKGHCLCLDILDAMNQTRATWGDKCYVPKREMGLPVIIAATTSCVLTGAFYLISKLAQSPKDTELARVNTLQSNMFEEGCECGAVQNEQFINCEKHSNAINGEIIQ